MTYFFTFLAGMLFCLSLVFLFGGKLADGFMYFCWTIGAASLAWGIDADRRKYDK